MVFNIKYSVNMLNKLFNKKKKEPETKEYLCTRTINLFAEKLYKEGQRISYDEWRLLPMIVRIYHFDGPFADGTYHKNTDYIDAHKNTHCPVPDFEKPEAKGKHHEYPHTQREERL